MRWCNYPGERLLKNVKFEVNGNPLDEYTSEATNFHREFGVQPNKQTGWNRCVGQEEVEHGQLDQPDWANNGVAASAIGSRTCVQTKSGLQTPTGQSTTVKPVTPDGDVEMFIPLLFWCNKDPRLSVPSVAIPYGQRFINIELASQDELVGLVGRGSNQAAPYADSIKTADGTLTTDSAVLKTIELYINNIFVNPEVHNIFIKRIGFTLIRVHRKQTSSTDGGEKSILLQQLKWPIEALFVGVRMADYNSSDPAKRRANLDKWHTFHHVANTERLSQGWQSQKVSIASSGTFAVALPTLFTADDVTVGALAGDRITWVVTDTTPTSDPNVDLKVGDKVTYTSAGLVTYTHTVRSINSAAVAGSYDITFEELSDATIAADINGNELIAGAIPTGLIVMSTTSAETSSHVSVCHPTMKWVTIKAHGIPIYNKFPASFYNAYLPYNYGGPNIRTPEDCGALMITFCLYPGTYQPSGHINVSRAREFYIDFETTSHVDGTNLGTLVVIASAINFLLISDGSAVLRYST
jgi:plastocyanin